MSLSNTANKSIQFVVKISKYCNLRCTYCYEFDQLSNKRRMSEAVLDKIFENLAIDLVEAGYEQVEFVWHGGEPFLIPFEYYDSIGVMQKKWFGQKLRVLNFVQTNLTVLTEPQLQHIKDRRFFDALGVSVDVYGDQRVTVAGKSSTSTVLGNMNRLHEADVPFGVIVVLERSTAAHAEEICNIFDRPQQSMRILPFYMQSSEQATAEQQIKNSALSHSEIVSALKSIFEKWFTSKHALKWSPIEEYVEFALAHLRGHRQFYSRLQDEAVFVVNTDGGVWGAGDTYEADCSYGNLLTQRFSMILRSPARKLVCDRATERTNSYCMSCQYYGACPGFYVSDASTQQQQLIRDSGCLVAEMIAYIARRLNESGIEDRLNPPQL